MIAMRTSARLLMLAGLAAFSAAPASAQTPGAAPPSESRVSREFGLQDLLRELSWRIRPRQRGRRDLPSTPASRPHADCDAQQGHVSGGPGVPDDRRPAGREGARRVADARLGGCLREVPPTPTSARSRRRSTPSSRTSRRFQERPPRSEAVHEAAATRCAALPADRDAPPAAPARGRRRARPA